MTDLIRFSLLWIFYIVPQISFAQDEDQGLLNKLLSPGPLIEGHKDLEHKDCLECHSAGKGVPNDKCLVCHKEIKESIAKKNTYHGKQKKDCYKCHPDHKGREYDSTKVNEKTFDHNETGYKLVGKHAKIDCVKCHTKKRTDKPIRKSGTRYFGTKRNCIGCHRKDDIHFFKGKWAKKSCDECHNSKSWKSDIKFDHSKDADYRLLGKHAKLDCETCHLPKAKSESIYEWPNFESKRCLSCHKDVHGNNLSSKFRGGRCDKCHTQQRWEIQNFDHGITSYRLRGKHARIKCEDCHKQSSRSLPKKKYKWAGLSKECSKCHRDYHGYGRAKSQRYGSLKKCSICHDEQSFKDRQDFNHNYDTRFKIDGKHRKNKCFDCHKVLGRRKNNRKGYQNRLYHWAKLQTKTCENCHKNPHDRSFMRRFKNKKCSDCHLTTGWKDFRKTGKGFDHDSTRFPLTGKHKKVKCDTCHKVNGKEVYRFRNASKQFCINCHKNVHKKQFKAKFQRKSCVECHTTNDFKKRKPFDHRKTDFPLRGKHAKYKNKCEKCHVLTKSVLPTKPPRRARKFLFKYEARGYCDACHTNVHKEQFHKKFYSKPCTFCHTVQNFTRRKPFNHDKTRFKIKGKHKKVKCQKCHIKTKKMISKSIRKRASKFKFPELRSKSCATCHKDVHKGEFGNRCEQCHNESGWKTTRDFHENFALSGVHYILQCQECHVGNRKLSGLSDNCLYCHRKDDVHGGTLSNCADCHRQSFWEATLFKHSQTSFPLRGSHRVEPCSSCHRGGNYTGIPSDCLACHQQDAAAVVNPPHNTPAFNVCDTCHNQFSFSGDIQVLD